MQTKHQSHNSYNALRNFDRIRASLEANSCGLKLLIEQVRAQRR